MTTKQMTREYLENKGCFKSDLPAILEDTVKCISTNASDKMKLMMAVTELMVFVSQLRKPIQMVDGTLLPINTISIVLAGSGYAKDSSMNQIRKALKPAYLKIEEYRIQFATEQAKRKAVREGKEEKMWMQFYSPPRDIFAGIGTIEGQLNHMAKLEEGELGAAYIQVSELGSELDSNKNIVDIIVAMAIGYDVGAIPSKIVKSDENQTPAIKALPFSGLLFGAQDKILYEESVKNKFKSEFTTKLSRRCFFNLNTEQPVTPIYKTAEEIISAKKAIKQAGMYAQQVISPTMYDLVDSTTQDPLRVSEETEAIYDIYQEYNDIVSREIGGLYPIAQLARKHMQWKCLKLAGAFAVLRGSDTLDEEDYIYAVNFAEMYSEDLLVFEKELAKESYEIFSDYMKSIAMEHKSEISAHALKKRGYLPGAGGINAKIKQLVQMATSYDKSGIYSIEDDKVLYEEIVKTNISGASFLALTGTKEERQYQCASGYSYAETSFPNMKNLLSMDLAYSPFEFKDGIRGRDHIVGGTSWLCLDIDEGDITDEELHFILEDVNHHIARTSNPNVANKFRVILQLDAYVDIPHNEWKYFAKSIGEYIGLSIDNLPKSQIFFGYAGRKVLSKLDGVAIDVKEHLLYAAAKVAEEKPDKELTTKEKSSQLATPFSTFAFAFEAKNGQGSRSMYSAARRAYTLGMPKEEIKALMDEISEYWEYPLPTPRLNVIKKQIDNF